VDSTGHATLIISSLSVGKHSLTAGYSGDSRFNPSVSSARTQTVSS
jgi:hypothetical protein